MYNNFTKAKADVWPRFTALSKASTRGGGISYDQTTYKYDYDEIRKYGDGDASGDDGLQAQRNDPVCRCGSGDGSRR